jgi:hypothetical protein
VPQNQFKPLWMVHHLPIITFKSIQSAFNVFYFARFAGIKPSVIDYGKT